MADETKDPAPGTFVVFLDEADKVDHTAFHIGRGHYCVDGIISGVTWWEAVRAAQFGWLIMDISMDGTAIVRSPVDEDMT